jgi:hypothetical protein
VDAQRDIAKDMAALLTSAANVAADHVDVLLAGYTHLQPAQPIWFSYWLRYNSYLPADVFESVGSETTPRKDNAVDIRKNLNRIEDAVRESLAYLPTLNQNLVLRKCLMNIEADPNVSKDYDQLYFNHFYH